MPHYTQRWVWHGGTIQTGQEIQSVRNLRPWGPCTAPCDHVSPWLRICDPQGVMETPCSICHGSTSQPSQWPSVTAPDLMFFHVLIFHINPLTIGGTSHHFPVIFGVPAAYSRFWLCGFGAAWASSAGDVRQAKWEMPYMHELCNARTFAGRCSLAICALNACHEVTGHYPFWLMDLGMTNFSITLIVSKVQ